MNVISFSQLQDMRPEVTAFSLLGLSPTFNLKPAALEKHYQILLCELHPDRFTQSAPIERETAQQMSAWANQAYTILKSPVERALEILRVKGMTRQEVAAHTHEPDVIAWAFENRERIMACESTEELEALKAELSRQTEDIALIFEPYEVQSTAALLKAYTRFSYLYKMLAEVNTQLRSLGGVWS
jgi:molecular chaperone HscB